MPGPKQRVNTAPSGTGTIETYCVAYGKDAPEKAYISSAASTARATASSPWPATIRPCWPTC